MRRIHTAIQRAKVEWGSGPDHGYIVRGKISVWNGSRLPDNATAKIKKECEDPKKSKALNKCTNVIIEGKRVEIIFSPLISDDES
jgi:hypothetical protein